MLSARVRFAFIPGVTQRELLNRLLEISSRSSSRLSSGERDGRVTKATIKAPTNASPQFPRYNNYTRLIRAGVLMLSGPRRSTSHNDLCSVSYVLRTRPRECSTMHSES